MKAVRGCFEIHLIYRAAASLSGGADTLMKTKLSTVIELSCNDSFLDSGEKVIYRTDFRLHYTSGCRRLSSLISSIQSS